MKKLLLSLTVFLLFFTLLCVGVSGAAKGKLSVSGDVTNAKPEDTFTLTVELNRNPGVQTLRCTLGFNPQVLDFVTIEGTQTLPNFSYEEKEDGLLLRWKSESNTKATGELAHVTMRVREDAIFGDSTVTLTVSETLYDAQNQEGDAVAFDTVGWKFTLLCPHETPTYSIEQAATFETEGILKETCPDCGNVSTQPLLPAVNSTDGRVGADVSVGEFSNGDLVEMRVEDLYGTEEEKTARDLLGENMFFAFRIRFTKNGEDYVPARDASVRLSSDFPLPQGTVLYTLVEGGALQTEFKYAENTMHFAYDDVVFALVKRPQEEPVTPSATTTTSTTTAVTSSTVDAMELQRRKDLFLIFAGVVTLLLCGGGMILILGRRKRY